MTAALQADRYMYVYDNISAELFLELKMFQTKVVKKNQNTHFVLNIFFVQKSRLLGDNVEKSGTAGQDRTWMTTGYCACALHTE
jgi:hypothetical protein